jgi:hypothetical protein
LYTELPAESIEEPHKLQRAYVLRKSPTNCSNCSDSSLFYAGVEYIFEAMVELNIDEGFLITGNNLRVSFEELLVGPLAVSTTIVCLVI